jgi:hypothetical protein
MLPGAVFRRRVLTGRVSVPLVGFAALVLLGGGSAGAMPQACKLAWRVSPAPRVEGELLGVGASSPTDIWAVGGVRTFKTLRGGALHAYDKAVLEHWDGTRWKTVSGPASAGKLKAVTALSFSSAWAVGGASGPGQTRLRWDGRRWSTVPTSMSANDLDATSNGHVWVVGADFAGGHARVERWDGTTWRALTRPPLQPNGVSAVANGQTWVVGESPAIAAFWDGRHWHKTATPNPAGGEHAYNALIAVDGTSPRDVWAVGYFDDPDLTTGNSVTPQQGSLIVHWNGRRWTVVPTPRGPDCTPNMDTCYGGDHLTGVTAIASDNAWVVGERLHFWWDNGVGKATSLPLVEHWDGHRWSVVHVPGYRPLNDIVAVSPTNVWAVGATGKPYTWTDTSPEPPSTPLILHYSCR